MSTADASRFLGGWDVTEIVYSADAVRLGTVRQQRTLTRDAASGSIFVHQVSEPSRELDLHPMAAFRGEFGFRLDSDGRRRLYRGPDVQGSATAFGGSFLCGQGVWPRFAHNFRSWSIALSESQQLTGGVFFRGARTIAVIIGVGVLRGSDKDGPALDPKPCIVSGAGLRVVFDLESGEETQSPFTRQAQAAGGWLEWGEAREDRYELRGDGDDYQLRRSDRAIGMAKAYGPMLCWELHGDDGTFTSGLDLGTTAGEQQFSLRQNFVHGRLVSLEGLSFNA